MSSSYNQVLPPGIGWTLSSAMRERPRQSAQSANELGFEIELEGAGCTSQTESSTTVSVNLLLITADYSSKHSKKLSRRQHSHAPTSLGRKMS